MSYGKVKNPPSFGPCRVAKSKTRRVSRYVVWQSPKPAGFQAMSCGKVQNPPGFAPCRVAKSKTRQVFATSCGKVQNLPGFAPCRVRKYETRRVSCRVVCENMKPAKFVTYPCRAQKHTPRKRPRQGFGYKIGWVLGVSLLGRVKSGAFLGASGCGNVKPAKFFIYPCRGAKAYAPKCPATGICA